MTREQKAQQCGMAANAEFFNEAREAVVSFARPDLDNSLVAFVKLNYRTQISEAEPSQELYLRLLRTALLELLDAGTITEIHPLTSLGWDYLDGIRRATGIRVQNLPAPGVPQLSADDILRNQIKQDWISLPGDKVRAKARADKNYHRLLEELLAGDGIDVPVAGRSNFIKIDGPDLEAGNRY